MLQSGVERATVLPVRFGPVHFQSRRMGLHLPVPNTYDCMHVRTYLIGTETCTNVHAFVNCDKSMYIYVCMYFSVRINVLHIYVHLDIHIRI